MVIIGSQSMYKIKDISKKIGLSRSTLLYYEKIGLIYPDKDYSNDYRLYSGKDLKKLQKICMYRDMGVPLNKIKNILEEQNTDIKKILEKQLININNEITKLRGQQQRILSILKIDDSDIQSKPLTKELWIEILQKSGLDKKGMENWHKEFEKNAPTAHQDFLENLGLTDEEIKKIRKISKT